MAPSDIWLQHFSDTLSNHKQLAYVWDKEEGNVSFLGDSFDVLGCLAENMPKTDATFCSALNPQDLPSRKSIIYTAIFEFESDDGLRDVSFDASYRFKNDEGHYVDLTERGTVYRDEESGKTFIRGILELNKNDQAKKNVKKREKDTTPNLSSLIGSNSARLRLQHAIEEAIERNLRNDNTGVLICVGIDKFSLINQVYGTKLADYLLLKAGQRLEEICGRDAKVIRLEGDVFGVVLKKLLHVGMRDLGEKIIKVFHNHAFETEVGPINLSVSVGGKRLKRNLSPSETIPKGERALQEAKRRGGACFIPYSEQPENDQSFKEILKVGDQILHNLREGRVFLAFQPIISSETKNVSFHESLIRMVDADGTVHAAGSFVEVAERLGLTRLIDQIAIESAFEELKMFPDLVLSVNVSNWTLADPYWIKNVQEMLRGYRSVAQRLIVEFTESAAVVDAVQSTRFARTLQGLGCKVALDDFGTGYTAFQQIRDLNLDIVKIDKSFVQNMHEKENRLFIKTLHALASGMNVETVGEGAETLDDIDSLTRDGITYIQGYAYAKPSLERVWLPENHRLRRKRKPA